MAHTPHDAWPGDRYDLVLVGGGLQNGLIALACLRERPKLRIAMVERAATLGGNHTWALHPHDVPEAARALVEPLITARWPGYDVRFTQLWRTLHAPYAAISSERFATVVSDALSRSPGSTLLLERTAQHVGADHVVLDDGRRLEGTLVVDARGPRSASPSHDDAPTQAAPGELPGTGYQKFLGLELELAEDHGLPRPLLMDATVEQTDGYRFFYVLPLTPTRLLVEDTAFSRSPTLDLSARREAVLAYARDFGTVSEVVREERGVLPMPWTQAATPASALCSPLVAGYRGGFFHPATGYSFPIALRLACLLAKLGPERAIGPELAAFMRAHRGQARFARQLNRLLFTGFAPDAMHHVFERFYLLPADLIHRFYALTLGPVDRARILIGRPPRGFSLARALSATPSLQPR